MKEGKIRSKMKKTILFLNKKLFAISVMLIFILPMITADEKSAYSFDPKENWYEISDWELEVCQKWGGYTNPNGGVSFSGDTSILYEATITLQGQIIRYPDNTSLIDVAYYLAPFGDSEYKYAVRLYNTLTKEKARITEPTDLKEAASFYNVNTYTKKYDVVQMLIADEDNNALMMTVPLVDEAGRYSQQGSSGSGDADNFMDGAFGYREGGSSSGDIFGDW